MKEKSLSLLYCVPPWVAEWEVIMDEGYILVGAATPTIKVADCDYNVAKIIELIDSAVNEQVGILVFPELSVTGASCDDLFFQNTLIHGAEEGVREILNHTKGKDILVVVGFPFALGGNLYNTAAVMQRGKVLSLIPKKYLNKEYNQFEYRYFVSGDIAHKKVGFLGEEVDFGSNILMSCCDSRKVIFGIEFSNEASMGLSPGVFHCNNGANLILNLSSRDEMAGGRAVLREVLKGQSRRLISGYIYAEAGNGESTTDKVHSGYNLILENGKILGDAEPFSEEMIICEMDFEIIDMERRKKSLYPNSESSQGKKDYIYKEFSYDQKSEEWFKGETGELTNKLYRKVSRYPFIPEDSKDLYERCEEIIDIQVMGLCKRLTHINCKQVVIGISGGLDSTLALLITRKAFDRLGLDPEGIDAITMPCFGTTDRTYNNSLILGKELETNLREIPIHEAVKLHFKDIGHNINNHDITYENVQARERTQVLMDIANMKNGIVIGTGSMSELALGWATYNGDHMSMYGVNISVPKSLVGHLVSHIADKYEESNKALYDVLNDIVKTPISPELLPLEEGVLAQKTEDLIGPYEVHDFFMYYVLRYGFRPKKIYGLAIRAFNDKYTKKELLNWLKVFYGRFFSQQFKRSTLPNGPKIGSISLSPRGEFMMPSDAMATLWRKELEDLKVLYS